MAELLESVKVGMGKAAMTAGRRYGRVPGRSCKNSDTVCGRTNKLMHSFGANRTIADNSRAHGCLTNDLSIALPPRIRLARGGSQFKGCVRSLYQSPLGLRMLSFTGRKQKKVTENHKK